MSVTVVTGAEGDTTHLRLLTGDPSFRLEATHCTYFMGAPLLSPAVGDGVGTIFTRGASPMRSRRRRARCSFGLAYRLRTGTA